jgi:hypothetical protein
MSRLRSDFWVGAYIRTCNGAGASAVLRRRGAAEAGAVFVVVDDLAGGQTLYAPAPQSLVDESGERMFTIMASGDGGLIADKLAREAKFDPDLWIIDVEDRAGLPRLPLAKA